MASDTDTPTEQDQQPLSEDGLRELLRTAVRGGAKITDAHLSVVDRDFIVEGTATTVHCYAPTLDGSGRMRMRRLAEFLRNQIINYAIPRSRVELAIETVRETGSTAEWVRLTAEARRLFTDLKNTGEGGELLLFALAEAVFELTQIMSKMSLKTSPSMHYNGADGIYARCSDDGFLDLYWGESKVYEKHSKAITDCLKSLAPFLTEELSEDSASRQDIFLINEFVDFSDERIVSGLKRYFQDDDPKSNQIRFCGFALVGFDSAEFPAEGAVGVWDEIEEALQNTLPKWRSHINKRLKAEKLESFDIHFICVPLGSAEKFREHFLALLETV